MDLENMIVLLHHFFVYCVCLWQIVNSGRIAMLMTQVIAYFFDILLEIMTLRLHVEGEFSFFLILTENR